MCWWSQKKKEKGAENIFEDIIAENFPNLGKEAQRVPYRINAKRNIPRHIVIKMTKIEDKERILKTAKEKQLVIYKGIPVRL